MLRGGADHPCQRHVAQLLLICSQPRRSHARCQSPKFKAEVSALSRARAHLVYASRVCLSFIVDYMWLKLCSIYFTFLLSVVSDEGLLVWLAGQTRQASRQLILIRWLSYVSLLYFHSCSLANGGRAALSHLHKIRHFYLCVHVHFTEAVLPLRELAQPGQMLLVGERVDHLYKWVQS